jgi:hypothetical protein
MYFQFTWMIDRTPQYKSEIGRQISDFDVLVKEFNTAEIHERKIL